MFVLPLLLLTPIPFSFSALLSSNQPAKKELPGALSTYNEGGGCGGKGGPNTRKEQGGVLPQNLYLSSTNDNSFEETKLPSPRKTVNKRPETFGSNCAQVPSRGVWATNDVVKP